MPPDTLPMVAGANCTLKVLDCPAARVSGRVRPVMLKPVPETVACETLTVVLPVFVSTTLWVLVVAAVTLPILMFDGFGRVWASGDCAPVPVKAMIVGELGALLTSETLP